MTKKVSVIGLFTAMALLLSCIENLLPFRTGIPGIKLGIANLIIVIAFYFLPFGEVLSISLLRVFFLSIFSGSPFNLAQLLISALLLNTPAFLWYSPVLLISGTVTGLINGLIATKIIYTVKGMKW